MSDPKTNTDWQAIECQIITTSATVSTGRTYTTEARREEAMSCLRHGEMCTGNGEGCISMNRNKERTYTEAELLLSEAALLRAAAKAIDNIYPDRTRGAADGMLQKCMEVVLAIPTDQPALDRHVAERVRDAVREEAEWWLHYHKLNQPLGPYDIGEARLAAHRAAAGAPEEKKL